MRSYPDLINNNIQGVYSIYLFAADSEDTKDDDLGGWEHVGHISWCVYKPMSGDGKSEGKIRQFWVNPDYRREGLGTRLFNDALCHLEKMKEVSRVGVCDSSGKCGHTQNYYSRFGFEGKMVGKKGDVQIVRDKVNAYLQTKGFKSERGFFICSFENVEKLFV